MKRPITTIPTLLIRPTTACPRCDGTRVLALAPNTGSSFDWHECGQCEHLWAMPRGWTPHAGPAISVHGE